MTETFECPDCDGSGYQTITAPVCCGRGKHACCGEPVPAPEAVECPICGGTGAISIPTEQSHD